MNTDSIKALARKHDLSIPAVRDLARECMGLEVDYSPERHTWFINEPASVVREFNERLATFVEDMAYDNE